MKIFVCIIFFSHLILSQNFTPAIEDNSLFIEEAYNQEERIVQHIFSLERINEASNPLSFSFTQEWPIGGEAHQLSYTIPISNTEVNGNIIGDVLLNYRYQLSGDDAILTSAPRISVIIPTGKVESGNGNDKVGIEVNIPFSKRFTNNFVMHYNLGSKIIPSARHINAPSSINKTINDLFIGASAIYLMYYNFNLMIEARLDNLSSRIENEENRNSIFVINPAIRYAIDFDNLQIVPIVAAPTYFEDGKSTSNILFYISFEHNF